MASKVKELGQSAGFGLGAIYQGASLVHSCEPRPARILEGSVLFRLDPKTALVFLWCAFETTNSHSLFRTSKSGDATFEVEVQWTCFFGGGSLCSASLAKDGRP